MRRQNKIYVIVLVISLFGILYYLLLHKPVFEKEGVSESNRIMGDAWETWDTWEYKNLTLVNPYNEEYDIKLKSLDFENKSAVFVLYSKSQTPIECEVKEKKGLTGSEGLDHYLWEVKDDGVVLLLFIGNHGGK